MRLLATGKWVKREKRWQMVVAWHLPASMATEPSATRANGRPCGAQIIRLATRRPTDS